MLSQPYATNQGRRALQQRHKIGGGLFMAHQQIAENSRKREQFSQNIPSLRKMSIDDWEFAVRLFPCKQQKKIPSAEKPRGRKLRSGVAFR